jgi:hypothetical protein
VKDYIKNKTPRQNSAGNFGVFRFLKEVAIRRIPAFYYWRKWGHFGFPLVPVNLDYIPIILV